MLEQTKRISFGISSALSEVEPEPNLHTPAPTKKYRLRNTGFASYKKCGFSIENFGLKKSANVLRNSWSVTFLLPPPPPPPQKINIIIQSQTYPRTTSASERFI